MARAWIHRMIATVLAAHFVALVIAVATGWAFTNAPGGRATGFALTFAIYGSALAALFRRGAVGRGPVRPVLVSLALLFTVRFHSARTLNNWYREHLFDPRPLSAEELRLRAALRLLATNQEQHRLATNQYASAPAPVSADIDSAAAAALSIIAHGADGWAAVISAENARCSMWVRDISLRNNDSGDGIPTCRVGAPPNQRAPRASSDPSVSPPVSSAAAPTFGAWTQHRGDERRTGIVDGFRRVTWDARLPGEIRASAAVAGNQVFVGTHGNGEFAALSLDDGSTIFRTRVPNWIHHEPIATPSIVVVAFGNSEKPAPGTTVRSLPSGVIAFDRRTGRERWRHLVQGPVMISPVLRDSIVAFATGKGEAYGLRVSDGAELWRTELPGFAVMGNPLILDEVMFIGLDLDVLCALDIRTGARLYCRNLHPGYNGAGHASIAAQGNFVAVTLGRVVHFREAISAGWYWFALGMVFGRPAGDLSEQILFGIDAATGATKWSTPLGIGDIPEEGHVAGTPTLVNGVAYVPSPINGRVFAIGVSDGRIRWSTDIRTVRGSVLVANGAVLAATRDSTLVVLDARTGGERCRNPLPGVSDRAGPTVAGATAILTLRNGLVLARSLDDWISCRSNAPSTGDTTTRERSPAGR